MYFSCTVICLHQRWFLSFQKSFWEGACKVKTDLLRHSSYNLVPSAIRTISSEIIANPDLHNSLCIKRAPYTVTPWSHHTADTFAVLPHNRIRSTGLCLPMATLRSKSHTPGNTVTFVHSVKSVEVSVRSPFTPQFKQSCKVSLCTRWQKDK